MCPGLGLQEKFLLSRSYSSRIWYVRVNARQRVVSIWEEVTSSSGGGALAWGKLQRECDILQMRKLRPGEKKSNCSTTHNREVTELRLQPKPSALSYDSFLAIFLRAISLPEESEESREAEDVVEQKGSWSWVS